MQAKGLDVCILQKKRTSWTHREGEVGRGGHAPRHCPVSWPSSASGPCHRPSLLRWKSRSSLAPLEGETIEWVSEWSSDRVIQWVSEWVSDRVIEWGRKQGESRENARTLRPSPSSHHPHPSLVSPGRNYSSPEGGACLTRHNRQTNFSCRGLIKCYLILNALFRQSRSGPSVESKPPPASSAVFLVSSQRAAPVFSQAWSSQRCAQWGPNQLGLFVRSALGLNHLGR